MIKMKKLIVLLIGVVAATTLHAISITKVVNTWAQPAILVTSIAHAIILNIHATTKAATDRTRNVVPIAKVVDNNRTAVDLATIDFAVTTPGISPAAKTVT